MDTCRALNSHNESRDSYWLSCMNLHNVRLVDSCQEQHSAVNSGMSAWSVPLTHSFVKLVRIIKKQATKASGNGPKCKQQLKKYLLKKT